MFLQRVLLLCIFSSVKLLEGKPGRTCIRYETYQAMSYGMQAYRDPISHWYSHRMHRLPSRTTRVGLRAKVSICCDLGYIPIEGTSDCKPVCYTCQQNEQCVGPNRCECKEGYRRASQGFYAAFYCTPIPATTSTPMNSTFKVIEEPTTLVDIASTATSTTSTTTTTPKPMTTSTTPKTTTTTEVFKSTLEVRETETATEQPCGSLCDVNEQCTEGICVCKEGYEIVTGNRTSKCEPTCKPPCQHANCVGPDICACWPGYERTDERSCHPVCSKETCTFGECSENGTCVCLHGFRSSGSRCIWTGDALLPDPKNCDCWLGTYTTEKQCLTLCDAEAEQPIVNCVNATLCQYSGMALACPDGMYSCSTAGRSQFEPSSSIAPGHEMLTTDEVNESAHKMTILIIGFIASILLLGVLTYVFLKYRHRFVRPSLYSQMNGDGDGAEGL